MWAIKQIIGSLLLSPLSVLWLTVASLCLRHRRPRLANVLSWSGLVLLYCLSTRLVATELERLVESAALPPATQPPQAIVVLGAGRYLDSTDHYQLSEAALARLSVAARLARRTHLPILVSGGAPDGGTPTEAELMATSLQESNGLVVRWIESGSNDTSDNARRSANMLLPAGISSIYLVTHSWHQPRARQAFRSANLLTIPESVPASSFARPMWRNLLPSLSALEDNAASLHELIGMAWRRLRN